MRLHTVWGLCCPTGTPRPWLCTATNLEVSGQDLWPTSHFPRAVLLATSDVPSKNGALGFALARALVGPVLGSEPGPWPCGSLVRRIRGSKRWLWPCVSCGAYPVANDQYIGCICGLLYARLVMPGKVHVRLVLQGICLKNTYQHPMTRLVAVAGLCACLYGLMSLNGREVSQSDESSRQLSNISMIITSAYNSDLVKRKRQAARLPRRDQWPL